MRWRLMFGGLLLLSGCAWNDKPPVQQMTPGSRLIYNGGIPIWASCDKGNILYYSQSGAFAIAPGGCPSGQP